LPVVEPNPSGDIPDTTVRALQGRIRQQELTAKLGATALQGASLDQLLTATARLTAEGLGVEFARFWNISSNLLLIRAGVGWDAGVIGVASVCADL
jgi:hypothetical protein